MSHLLQRYRLFIIGGVIITAATSALLLFTRDKRFDVGGVAINPAARIKAERTYELVVWEEELIIPWAAKTQSEMLVDAIREFQNQWPNAAITYTIVEPESAREKLDAAIAAGVPPDVYATARGVVRHPRLQVPASPYLPAVDDDEPGLLSPVATGMLSADNNVWGWPRAVWWQTWLGRVADGTGAGAAESLPINASWTWDQFQQWVRNGSNVSRSASRNFALALNVLDIAVLEQFMSNAGAPAYTDAEGHLLWNEASLTDVASFLRTLQREAILPDKAADAARTRLEELFSGDATVIGPVSPHLAQAIFRHTPDGLTLLPIPRRPSDQPVATLDVSAYFVFRHAAYEGDDHTRLAAELAAFLAEYSERWLVESLGLLPVRAGGRAVWNDSAPFTASSRALLQTYIEQAESPYTMSSGLQGDRLRAAVLPHWRRFWNERVTAEQFAIDVMGALRDALTPE